MKNLGWSLFWALLLGDVVAVAMLKLSIKLGTVITVAGLVFIILAAVMFFAGNARERSRKREQEATAKLAEMQEKAGSNPTKDEPAQ